MSAAREYEGAELESPWLFRQGGLVLGPVPGRQLVDKLLAGELTVDSPVSPAGEGSFRRMGDVEAFRLPVARAQVKVRVEAEAQAAHAKLRRQRLGFLGASAAGVLVVAGLAWQGGGMLAAALPRHTEAPPEVSVELASITVARESKRAQLFEYEPGDAKRAAGSEKPTAIASAAGASPAGGTPSEETEPPGKQEEKPETPAGAVATAAAAKAGKGAKGGKEPKEIKKGAPREVASAKGARTSRDADGLETVVSYDQEAINRVVKTKQTTLYRCLQEEAQRRPGFSAKVPIEFVIGNDGRVEKLWVDHPELKRGPLYDCLFAELRKWPFKPYKGERATVGLSFNVGKKG